MSKTRSKATKKQIKDVKKELTESDDDSATNEYAVNGGNRSNVWTHQQSLMLIDLIRQQTSPEDPLSCTKRLSILDWNKIKIPHKSLEARREHLKELITGIPRYRTLREVVTDSERQRLDNSETAANNMTKKGSNETVKRKNAEDEKNTKRVRKTAVQKPVERDTNGIEVTADAKTLKNSKEPVVPASKESETNGIGMTGEKADAKILKKSKGPIKQAGGEGEVIEIEDTPKPRKRQEKMKIKQEITESDGDENEPTVQKPNGTKKLKVPAKKPVKKESHETYEDECIRIKPKSKKIKKKVNV